MQLPKRVRITEDHDSFKAGEEYEVEGDILAAGYRFYEVYRPEDGVYLVHASKSEVIEYYEPS